MKKIIVLVSVFLLFSQSIFSQKGTTVVAIKNSESAPIINKNIYGHFAEHLGRCIYGGLFVGDTSKIPNTNGVRNDIIKTLKNFKKPNLRLQGGCFGDTYKWKK